MKPRQIQEKVYWMGAVDWDRRLFDSLIPLPDGTSYNAYLVEGSEKTALMDTVDPNKADVLLSQLQDVTQVDYVIAHHAEQDHSGSTPQVLARYENAKVVATPKAKEMLIDLYRSRQIAFSRSRTDRPCLWETRPSSSSTLPGCTGPRRW